MRKGVPKDGTQAATWFRKAADQGEAGALSKLLDPPTQPIADARIACISLRDPALLEYERICSIAKCNRNPH